MLQHTSLWMGPGCSNIRALKGVGPINIRDLSNQRELTGLPSLVIESQSLPRAGGSFPPVYGMWPFPWWSKQAEPTKSQEGYLDPPWDGHRKKKTHSSSFLLDHPPSGCHSCTASLIAESLWVNQAPWSGGNPPLPRQSLMALRFPADKNFLIFFRRGFLCCSWVPSVAYWNTLALSVLNGKFLALPIGFSKPPCPPVPELLLKKKGGKCWPHPPPCEPPWDYCS